MGRKPAPVKPARSYEEQIRRMAERHGLIVEDMEGAKQILSTVNYYRLTTYGKQLRRADDPERFLPGVSLETLYALYRFDMGLRHAVMPVLEFFEVQLRAKIAYHLAMTYGSLGYMDADNFRSYNLPGGANAHKSLIGKFKTEVRRQADLPFVRHHNEKYGGKFPVWVAVELFTFGMLCSLYEMMKPADQHAVSASYNLSGEALAQLIRCAVDVRNICAHYNRLYNQPLTEQPLLFESQRLYESEYLFPMLLALRGVALHEHVWSAMLGSIQRLCVLYPEADLAACGFPQDWMLLLS